MIEHYVASLGLIKGLRVSDYESIAELEKAAGEAGAALRMANKYLVEKGSLVDGRDKFAEELEKQSGFPMKVKKVVKKKSDGTETTTEEPEWTEVQYVAAFRKAIGDGSFSHPRFPKDDLERALQDFADSLGAFIADAKRPERVAKAKSPGKTIMERVAIIWANGTQDKWREKIVSEGIPVEFGDDKEKNQMALGWAIKEREDRRLAQEAKQYA